MRYRYLNDLIFGPYGLAFFYLMIGFYWLAWAAFDLKETHDLAAMVAMGKSGNFSNMVQHNFQVASRQADRTEVFRLIMSAGCFVLSAVRFYRAGRIPPQDD